MAGVNRCACFTHPSLTRPESCKADRRPGPTPIHIPYTATLTRLGKMRSAGITDLRHGNLIDEDWEGRDRSADKSDVRKHIPLPKGAACYAIASTLSTDSTGLSARRGGDGLVSVDSALGRRKNPALTLPTPGYRQWTGSGIGHLDLLSAQEVYKQIERWLAPRS